MGVTDGVVVTVGVHVAAGWGEALDVDGAFINATWLVELQAKSRLPMVNSSKARSIVFIV